VHHYFLCYTVHSIFTVFILVYGKYNAQLFITIHTGYTHWLTTVTVNAVLVHNNYTCVLSLNNKIKQMTAKL